MSSRKAVVLAGGFGTRIRHVLPGLPKPMAPVAGRPFVEWVVRYLAAQGINEVIISTGFLGETIESHFATRSVSGVDVRCVREASPLGTAGGFLHCANASPRSADQWVVANGDSLVLADLQPLFLATASPAIEGGLVGLVRDDASRYGTLEIGPDNLLRGFREKRPGNGLINGGLYLFSGPLLSRFPAKRPLSFEAEVFPRLLAENVRFAVHAVSAPFLDIGTEETLRQAEAFVLNNQRSFAA